ncbi:hypothetical protein SAMN06265795_102256 [Noviherbaspirillum humi]|uniref:Uncharacterized protein n=1 Tax=Noviherbaspirillum humi TaxID=1688639 RepID=A0A239DNE4_9BURK|nr:hypothetical protein [Noviherbaspirillum humi]SNS33312.1 hypothetical protein SAMN06265795_102256 [Noviherbaspirillum humi]
MTDREMHDLIIKCKLKGNASWEVLLSQFSRQLVAISDRLSEDELYSLMDIAMTCYQKGYQELWANDEAMEAINRARLSSRQSSQ